MGRKPDSVNDAKRTGVRQTGDGSSPEPSARKILLKIRILRIAWRDLRANSAILPPLIQPTPQSVSGPSMITHHALL